MTHRPALPRTAYSVPEVARSLGISRRFGYQLAQSGELPTFRLGGRVLVDAHEFEAFLAAARGAGS